MEELLDRLGQMIKNALGGAVSGTRSRAAN